MSRKSSKRNLEDSPSKSNDNDEMSNDEGLIDPKSAKKSKKEKNNKTLFSPDPKNSTPIPKKKDSIEEASSDGEREEGEEQEHQEEVHEDNSTEIEPKKGKSNRKKFSVLQTANVVRLDSLIHADIKQFRKYCQSVNLTDEVGERNKLIENKIKKAIRRCLLPKWGKKEASDWETWTDEIFFERLLLACPDENQGASSTDVVAKIKGTKLNYSVWSKNILVEYGMLIDGHLETMEDSAKTPEKRNVW